MFSLCNEGKTVLLLEKYCYCFEEGEEGGSYLVSSFLAGLSAHTSGQLQREAFCMKANRLLQQSCLIAEK